MKPDLCAILETIRARCGLPALAAARFTTTGLTEMAAVGMRKAGADIPACDDDLWHLGSDTKAMTATLAGTFFAEGNLSLDAEILLFFPEIAASVPEAMKGVTLAQLLDHRAGLAANLGWNALSEKGSVMEQRRSAALAALLSPGGAPGRFEYSNAGYVVAGAVLERIAGKPWEDLLRERVFTPLGMTSAGFGGTGTPGKIDQPWPHDGRGVPTATNGPDMDNPPILGPAGTVHCTMADWARFLADQLRSASGLKALLPDPNRAALDMPEAGDGYARGWAIRDRDWAGGIALTHAGSNTWNACICWLAPARGFGVLACTNQGGDAAFQGCDEAVGNLIEIRANAVTQAVDAISAR